MTKNSGKSEALPSFDDIMAESRKRRRIEEDAQNLLGSKKHIQQSAQAILGSKKKHADLATGRYAMSAASLVPRAGINKRTAPAPRNASLPSRFRTNGNPAEAQLVQILSQAKEASKARNTQQSTLATPQVLKSDHVGNDEADFSIRGAAGYVVIARNFVEGTTAEDIEHVMEQVSGGTLVNCKLLAKDPVTVEMSFSDKLGADKVIRQFHNQKADGHTLEVYLKYPGKNSTSFSNGAGRRSLPAPQEPMNDRAPESAMDVDDSQAESREVQDRLREERRAGPRFERPFRDDPPAGPRRDLNYGGGDEYYSRPPQHRQESRGEFMDGRYGFNDSGERDRFAPRRGGRFGGGGGDGRLQFNGMRRGGGQSYRPF